MKRGKMKRGRPVSQANGFSQIFKFAAYGTLGLGAAGNSSAETAITFEGFTTDNLEISGIPGYGDNVSSASADWSVRAGLRGVVGTPDIAVDWLGTGWHTYTSWDGRGNVGQLDFNAGGPLISLAFTPSAASAVRLVLFELDEWAGGGPGSIDWTLVGSLSGQMAGANWTMTDAGGRSGFFIGQSGQLGETLTLNFMLNTGAPSYFALDNLTFDQVPEPSTWALGALGAAALGAAAMRRRRRAH
ncbi:MAG: PEP-CTERM sorting domain-containing protein [Gemmataceae bacterium]|nr:PEP-CTERM sorting domain-containing protein [Gemmataceae bacterium]